MKEGLGIILSVLHINIYCDPSSELSQPDGSDEGSQHMVSVRNEKNILNYHKILLLSRALTIIFQVHYYLVTRL